MEPLTVFFWLGRNMPIVEGSNTLVPCVMEGGINVLVFVTQSEGAVLFVLNLGVFVQVFVKGRAI